MDECGHCNSEVTIFFHKAINFVRLYLLEEYSKLQLQYFEERINFKYWHDYYAHYVNNYQIKFQKFSDGIMMCDSFIDRRVCINSVILMLINMGYEELCPVKLMKGFLDKEKSIEEITGEFQVFINSEFFNKF